MRGARVSTAAATRHRAIPASLRSRGPSLRARALVFRSLRGFASCSRTSASFDRLEIVGQEPRVDDLAVVDFAGDRADRALGFDHALEAVEMNLALAPVRHALGGAGGEVAHGALRHLDVDVVLLGDDLGGLVRVRLHELHRLAARADDGTYEVAFLLQHFDGGDADDVVQRRQDIAGDDDRAIFALDLRPERLGDRGDVDLA